MQAQLKLWTETIFVGAYKPVVKCYDFNELSLKFERGLDSEVIKMLVLSNDYSKVCILLFMYGGKFYYMTLR